MAYTLVDIKNAAGRIAHRCAVDDHGCWIWPGATYRSGYGQVNLCALGTKQRMATHRIMLMAKLGQLLDPAIRALHAEGCDRRCCNPAHLRAGTSRENNIDTVLHGTWRSGASSVATLLPPHLVRAAREQCGLGGRTVMEVWAEFRAKGWTTQAYNAFLNMVRGHTYAWLA